MWYSGKAAMPLMDWGDPALARAGMNQAWACKVALMMLPWLKIAPLDRPVVPPVYCKKAVSSWPSLTGLKLNLAPERRTAEKSIRAC